jgi:predicted dehydrogenase
MSGNDTLRIGFVGAGGIVRDRHVPGLRKAPDVEFYGVVNRSRESSQRAAEEFGIERTYDNWQELVADPKIDIVLIGAHPYMHRIVTEAALDAGKHVFTQARMALNYVDAKAMYAAAQRHPNLTTMISPPPHFMPGDRLVRRMLKEGFVGEPCNIVVQSYNGAYLDASAPRHWRQRWDISGFNTLDLGMMIEVTHRWLGYGKRVTALERTFTTSRPDGQGGMAPVERPDTLSAVAELESGALATITCSGVAAHAGTTNGFSIYGTEGTILYPASSGYNTILAGKTGDKELKEVPIPADERREWTAEVDFIKAIREGRNTVEPTFQDGLKYMEMTEAVFRSIESGQTVTLPLD